MGRALVYDGLQELYGVSVVVGLYMTGWDGSYPLDCYDCKSTCSGKKVRHVKVLFLLTGHRPKLYLFIIFLR